MAIIRITTPDWVRQEMEKKQGIQQQRTVIPSSVFTQGLSGPQRPGAPSAISKQRDLDQKMSSRQDAIPAILRQGEEVIPPEIVNKMGGRDEFLRTLNDKLSPTGISLHGGKGPVMGGQAEGDTLDGTIRPTDNAGYLHGADAMASGAPGFAKGTCGLRFGMARGGQAPASTSPTDYAGGIFTNTRETPPSSIQYNPRQKQSMGTSRVGYASGTAVAAPQTTSQNVTKTNSFSAPAPAVAAPQTSTPNTTTNTVQSANSGPQAAAIAPAVQGLGFTPQDITQTSLYKTQAKAADEGIQKAGAVQGMQNAQNLAQQGVGQSTAAGKTSAAQQTSQTESQIASANTQIAQTAQQQQSANLQTQMQLAYQSGDWGAVNKSLSAMGQSPIDFTNLEQQRQSGNLNGAAQTLFNLANSITGTDAQSIATKSALSQEATGLLSTGLKTTLGAQYNPETLATAVSHVSAGNIADPATETFVTHVASAPLAWIQNSQNGQLFSQMIENNDAGKDLLNKANSGDENAISLLAQISTYAASNDSNVQLPDTAVALLKQYGVYINPSSVTAANNLDESANAVVTGTNSGSST